jgi:predicted nicotinamide N-methyase
MVRMDIRDHTAPGAPPLVPEVTLYLADEPIALWEHTEREQGGAALPPPFWAFAWAGGQAMARHVLDNPALVRGRRVLDVASGGGLVAIAAALAGAASVTAVEIDALAVEAIAVNAARNGVAVDAVLADVLDGDGGDAEVVFAGDVFYSRDMTARMLAFVQRAHRRGASVLIGDPGRAYLPKDDLDSVAVYDVPTPTSLEDGPVKKTTVWRPR